MASAQPALQQSTWLRSARTTVRPPVVADTSTLLPGRVAAQLFVLGRTAEHAELVIRLIRTVLARLDQPLGVGVDGGAESLQVLLMALGTVSGFDPVSEPDEEEIVVRPDDWAREVPGRAARSRSRVGDRCGSGADVESDGGRVRCPEVGARPNRRVRPRGAAGPDVPTDRRALSLLLDAGVDGSLVSSLGLLVDAAYSVREQLSSDSWQLVGDVEEELARLRNRPPTQLVGVQSSLQRLLQALLALAGLSAENMERDSAWLFLDAGRRLERAQSLVRLLRSVLVRQRAGVVEDLLLESLLKTSESLIIFRRRSGSIMHVAGAVDLLVYDAANPRSVIYQLDRLFNHLADLPKQSPGQRLGDGEQLVLRTTTMLRLTDAAHLAEVDPATPATDRAGRRARPGGPSAGRAAGQPALDLLLPRAPVGAGRPAAQPRTEPMMYRIVHRTNYRYNAPVSRCRNEAHLRPRDTERQHCLASELVVEPTPTSWTERTDFFGNPVVAFAVDGPFRRTHRGFDQLGVGLRTGAPARHRAGLGAGPRPAGRRPEPGDAGRPRVLLRVAPGADVSRRPHLRRALLHRGTASGRGRSPTSPSASSTTSPTTPDSPR